MDWKYLFTSFHGRIGRQSFWMGSIVFIFILAIASAVDRMLGTIFNWGFGIVGWIVLITYILLIYPGLALYAKRWHDRGKSGWWSLIAVVPIAGGVWILIELGLMNGMSGRNRYGIDPLA